MQQPWSVINAAVKNTLATITLSDLINPSFPRTSSVLSLSDPDAAQASDMGPTRAASAEGSR